MTDDLNERIAALEAENAALKALCKDAERILERAPIDETHCPSCRVDYATIRRNGHPNCRLSALLEKLRSVK